jgi:ribonucleoside-diphosphate reductase alpha chain
MYGILLGDGHLSKEGRQWGVSGHPQRDDAHIQFVRQYLAERGIHSWETGRGESLSSGPLGKRARSGARRHHRDGSPAPGPATMPFGHDDIYDKDGRQAHLAPVSPTFSTGKPAR